LFFARRYWGTQAIAVDLSRRTLAEARKRIVAPFVNASVLALPFRNEIADFITCTGVIHHTPNPRLAFHELARVLRPGGGLFLSVYNRRSVYFPVYKYAGGLFRKLVRCGLGWLVRGVFIPMYAAAYVPLVWLATRRASHVPYAQAAADFDDKFLSPLAQFYRPREIEQWIEAEGMSCLDSGTHMAGMMLGFLIKKGQPSAVASGETGVHHELPAGKQSHILPPRVSTVR
jgi:ubiquinone/menaquinone biosynthesis C-methylase UbiE